MTGYLEQPAPDQADESAELEWGYYPPSLVGREMGWDEGFDEVRQDDSGQDYGVLVDEDEVYLEDWHGHRVGGPSFRCDINGNHEEEWRVNGLLHREDGPAQILEVMAQVYAGVWAKNGDLDRDPDDGPAIDYDDQLATEEWSEWWVEGRRHRLDGPAVIFSSNRVTAYEWWVDGECRRKVVLESESENVDIDDA